MDSLRQDAAKGLGDTCAVTTDSMTSFWGQHTYNGGLKIYIFKRLCVVHVSSNKILSFTPVAAHVSSNMIFLKKNL